MTALWAVFEPTLLSLMLLLAVQDVWRRFAPLSHAAARQRFGLWLLRPGRARLLRRCGLRLLRAAGPAGACGGCRDCAPPH